MSIQKKGRKNTQMCNVYQVPKYTCLDKCYNYMSISNDGLLSQVWNEILLSQEDD